MLKIATWDDFIGLYPECVIMSVGRPYKYVAKFNFQWPQLMDENTGGKRAYVGSEYTLNLHFNPIVWWKYDALCSIFSTN